MFTFLLEAAFWCSVAAILYVYLGYPLLLAALALRAKPRTIKPPPTLQTVTVIIAAFNEEGVIADKLVNTLQLDYPKNKLQIIVGSDGSTDATDEIVRRYADRGVELIRVEGRQGKTAVQNAAVQAARGEVLVFSDANAMYAPGAIKRLVHWFSDGEVGCVEGRRLDFALDTDCTGGTELLFHDYESFIKDLESRTYSCVGATGPIYAVRKELYVPLAHDLISDLIEPIMIMARHRKVQLFDRDATSREAVELLADKAYRRKVRLMTRALYSLRQANRSTGILNPFRFGWYSIQLLSHKVLRYLIPVFLLLALLSSGLLADRLLYGIAMFVQLGLYSAALIGAMQQHRGRPAAPFRLAHYFVLANIAALAALIAVAQGRNVLRWDTGRGRAPLKGSNRTRYRRWARRSQDGEAGTKKS